MPESKVHIYRSTLYDIIVTWSHTGSPNVAIYSASKAGVRGLTQAVGQLGSLNMVD